MRAGEGAAAAGKRRTGQAFSVIGPAAKSQTSAPAEQRISLVAAIVANTRPATRTGASRTYLGTSRQVSGRRRELLVFSRRKRAYGNAGTDQAASDNSKSWTSNGQGLTANTDG